MTSLMLALAAQAGLAETGCPVETLRWQEDCSSLADSERRGIAKLRYLPIRDDHSVWLSMGGQYRVRWESLDAINFGLKDAPRTDSIAHRALLHVDFRANRGWRMFTQLSYAAESGRSPDKRPIDESGIDVSQWFIEHRHTFRRGFIRWRLGRQELHLGNSLLGLRDGVVLRRGFDAVRLDVSVRPNWLATVIAASPVHVNFGTFDDERVDDEQFYALHIQRQWLAQEAALFVFHRRKDDAEYFAGIENDARTMVGVRWDLRDASFDAVLQGGIQFGKWGDQGIRAWGAIARLGWRPEALGGMRVGINLSAATGDDELTDNELKNFEPMYPNLSVLTAAPLYNPTNQLAAGVNLSGRVKGDLSWSTSVFATGRYDTNDAVYLRPRIPATGAESEQRLSALLFEVRTRWDIRANLFLDGAVVFAAPKGDIKRSEGGRMRFVRIQLTAQF